MISSMGRVWVGCSGWNYKDWREDVYGGAAQRLWLGLYAKRFDTVEVNSTFYRLPTQSAVCRWAEQVPNGFLFAIKVSRYLTHIKRLSDPDNTMLLNRVQPLAEAGSLGPLLWQLPENFHRDDQRLARALKGFPSGYRHCIEFRHASWFCEPVMEALRGAGVALVIGDHPDRTYQTHDWTTDWTYIRFHHGARGRRGNYSPSEIATWSRRFAAWRSKGDIYAYFNNDWESFAVRNAQALK
jgi:uncharacterized protein YecE (DUF72 family)